MDMHYRSILTGDSPQGSYPLHLLRRTEIPTTAYSDATQRRTRRAEKKDTENKPFYVGSEPMLSSFAEFQHYIAGFKLPPVASTRAPLPDNPHIMARHIKAFAYFTGADMVGICKLPPSTVFTDNEQKERIECNLKYAIILLNVKHRPTVAASYGREWIDDPTSFVTYQKCACQAQTLTGYIRRLGWPSESSIFDKYITMMPRLVIDAGLGEASRTGIALNPFVGSSFKVSAVLTDLPMEIDMPIDFGLQSYCARCRICAEQCPMQAISYGDKEIYNGYETWPLKRENCLTGIHTNKIGNICERCTKICPWNRPDSGPEEFKGWDGDSAYLHRLADARAEELKKNAYRDPQEYTDKWWLPLAESELGAVEAPEFDYATLDKRLAWIEKRNRQD